MRRLRRLLLSPLALTLAAATLLVFASLCLHVSLPEAVRHPAASLADLRKRRRRRYGRPDCPESSV